MQCSRNCGCSSRSCYTYAHDMNLFILLLRRVGRAPESCMQLRRRLTIEHGGSRSHTNFANTPIYGCYESVPIYDAAAHLNDSTMILNVRTDLGRQSYTSVFPCNSGTCGFSVFWHIVVRIFPKYAEETKKGQYHPFAWCPRRQERAHR